MRKRVIKFINSRNTKDKQRIKKKFLKLKQNRYPSNLETDSKKLQNTQGFRLRVDSYRFIYDVVESELTIYMEQGDNRGDIY